MKIAFCLTYYFPYGGQQRDFLRIASLCQEHGHTIHIFVMELNGELPPSFKVTEVPGRGFSNHRRVLDFSRRVGELLKDGQFDVVVGFTKLPDLDVYYAADTCYLEKALAGRGPLYRFSGRYRTYAALERAVFAPESQAQILLIAAGQQTHFMRHYGTPAERFHLLPPGISRDRIAPPDAAEIRRDLRRELGIGADEQLILLIGSAFRTKGLDRALQALAALDTPLRNSCRLGIVGQDKAEPFERLASRLGIRDRVSFFGGRSDVPRFLLGADLLLHPAYVENTGTVLVEALAAGLPVLASAVCGYGEHVERAGAGLLIPEPFAQKVMNGLLARMLTSAERPAWRRNALAYAAAADLYSLHERAVAFIEAVGRGEQ